LKLEVVLKLELDKLVRLKVMVMVMVR